MAYQPGHDYYLRAADSPTVISDTTGAITGAPLITAAFDVGYLSPNQVTIDDGTRHGFAAGNQDALYHAKGWRAPSLSADIRLGSVAFVQQKCLANGVALPYQDLFYGISGSWARAIYKAKCARLALSFNMTEASELTASATFEGQAYAPATTIALGYNYNQFGPALLATDVRTMTINGVDVRPNIMSLSVEIDRGLERKNGRPDFGDNVPGSRTAYELLTHHKTVSGSLTFHDLPVLESSLFYNTVNSMVWSNIIVTVNDIANGAIYDLTITNPRPVSRTQNAIESAAQMNWTVPFIASNCTIANTRAVVV